MFSRIKFKTEGEYDDSYDYSMSSSEFDQDLNQFINLLDYTVSFLSISRPCLFARDGFSFGPICPTLKTNVI